MPITLSRVSRVACPLAALLIPILVGGAPAIAPSPTPAFRADRILIKPNPGGEPQSLVRFHTAGNVRVLRQFPGLENIQVLQLPRGAEVPVMVRRYQQSGLVAFAEPDHRLRPDAVPNDPAYADGSLWHLNNFGQSGGTPDADIDAPEAWDSLDSASTVIVAVVDTGIRYTHEDLAANMWVNPGEIAGNGIDDDGDGFIDDVHGINAAANNGNPMDLFGHGTQVAGFIGSVGNNGRGTAGIAWRVKLMACRFYDDAGNGYVSDAVQAIDFARSKGAQVINASFVSSAYASALYSALNSCRSAGIILVAAAGNDAQDNDANPHYPASFDLDNIVAVAATTRNDALAGFSDYGATSVDLAAPGENVLSTYNSSDSAYAWNNGTSFSSPIVAGALALMRARYPTATHRQLIDQLLAATDPLPSLAGKCVSGGRLNLARALGPAVVAGFTAGPLAGNVPLTVRFTNTSIGAITSLLWNFGDGTATTSEQHPIHTYTGMGNFTASLTVNGSSGTTSTTSRTIVVVANYRMTNAPFAWVDPGDMPSLGLSGDAVSAAQTLPFAFQFYGQSYSALYVAANGLVGFSNQGLATGANTDLPDASAPNNIICPLWDDLAPAAASVRMGTAGAAPNRKVVISWLNASAAGGGPPVAFTFQVILEESSNNIRLQYLDVQPGSRNGSAAGKSATVGLEHSSGWVAAKYSYNGSTPLANNQAILFTPAVTNSVPNSPPTVAITNPSNGLVLPAPASFSLQATATDGDGAVGQVEFFNGPTSLGIDSTSPYSVPVNNLGAGTFVLSAVATDNAGAKATNSVAILINSLPTASISSPTNGQSFLTPASVAIVAIAGDSDGAVTNVEFFSGATRLGQDGSNPFSLAWSGVSAGTYALTVKATDNRGAITTSAPVTIVVTNSPPQPVTVLNAIWSATEFTFSFASEAGRNYVVQYTDAIGSGSWLVLTNLAGNGSTLNVTNRNPSSGSRFYRVESK